jgi:hypothetical protein
MQQFYKFITWRFVSLNMFRAPPSPSSEALTASGFTLERGGSSVVSRGLAGYNRDGSSVVSRGLAGYNRPDHD